MFIMLSPHGKREIRSCRTLLEGENRDGQGPDRWRREERSKARPEEAIGKATGDAKLQADGNADKAEGKIQNAVGGLKDTVRDALKR